MKSKLNIRALFVCICLFALAGTAAAQPQLVNPSFDDPSPGLGQVPSFPGVVGPPFAPGYWGAEGGFIVASGASGAVTPLSTPFLLSMPSRSGVATQAWQVVHVTSPLPVNPMISFGANFTVNAATAGARAGVTVRTYATGTDFSFPPTLFFSQPGLLDGPGATWQSIDTPLLSIPANTEWILCEVLFNNADLIARNTGGFVDNAGLTIVPEPASLSLIGMSCALVLRRRR